MDHITYDLETAHVLWSTVFSGTVERAAVRTGVSVLSRHPLQEALGGRMQYEEEATMQSLRQVQWTQHTETPRGPGVEMTPE